MAVVLTVEKKYQKAERALYDHDPCTAARLLKELERVPKGDLGAQKGLEA
jgi:hypothetical protein